LEAAKEKIIATEFEFLQRLADTLTQSDRDRGSGYPLAPPTPPCVRVRTRRFGGLS
jgi:hypothetical protein